MITTNKQFEQLCDIYNLKDNWNGYKAEDTSVRVIENVLLVLEKVENKEDYEISLTTNNSIQLEKEENDFYIEIEVKKYSISIFVMNNKNNERYECTADMEMILKEINANILLGKIVTN